MISKHHVTGATLSSMMQIAAEVDRPEFRVREDSPFILQFKHSYFDVMFMHDDTLINVGKITAATDQFIVDTKNGLGADVHAAVSALVPDLARAADIAHTRLQERNDALKRDLIDLLGPKDQNRKTLQLKVKKHEFLTLAAFAGYFNAALFGGLALRESSTRFSENDLEICLKGEKRSEVPVMRFKIGTSYISVTSDVPGEKPRETLVDTITASMFARRDRILNDPDLEAAAHAFAATKATRILPSHMTSTTMMSVMRYRDSHDRHRIYARDVFGKDYKDRPLVHIDVGHGLKGVVRDGGTNSSLVGITFKDQVICTENGFLPGMKNAQLLYHGVYKGVIKARPELFPNQAQSMRVAAVVETEDVLVNHIKTALETGFEDPDTPIMTL